jgi:hypothetical protein
MGVLYDYFRAPGPAAVLRAMDRAGGPLTGDAAGESAFDGLDAKGIDPKVVLGQLVAFIRDVPWSVDVVATDTLWPPPETRPASREAWGELPEDSPWMTGPWLERLGADACDALAGVGDDRLPALAGPWAGIEEFGSIGPEPEVLLELLGQLVDLARRARASGDQLYCWMCL